MNEFYYSKYDPYTIYKKKEGEFLYFNWEHHIWFTTTTDPTYLRPITIKQYQECLSHHGNKGFIAKLKAEFYEDVLKD